MAARTHRPGRPSKVRYGYHPVTDCLKANQGVGSHRNIEATLSNHFNTYIRITKTKAKPFPNGTQADILLSGISAIDNPAARNWNLDVTSTNPMGSPTGSSSTVLPSTTSRARANTILASRPHQRKARGGSQTPQVRHHLRGSRVSAHPKDGPAPEPAHANRKGDRTARPLLCILVAAVSVIQSITPYLVAQARLVPTFFIVLEQIVLMPIRATRRNTTHRRSSSSESDSSRRSSASGLSKAEFKQAAPDTSSALIRGVRSV
jgi:hypothetical protein